MTQQDNKIDVLDHGYVRLVDHMGSDLSIVRNARNSYNASWRAGEDKDSDFNLLSFLMRNRHTTPVEGVEFQFDVKLPIFIVRQWHRHRTWSYNEISARYTPLPEEYYVPEPAHIGSQSKTNKQVRDLDVPPKGGLPDLIRATIDTHSATAFRMYQKLLDYGTPRELARCVLPVNTYTRMFAKVDLHNLFHFLELRLHPHAQWEIQQYAEAMLQLIEPIVPVTVQLFRKFRLKVD